MENTFDTFVVVYAEDEDVLYLTIKDTSSSKGGHGGWGKIELNRPGFSAFTEIWCELDEMERFISERKRYCNDHRKYPKVRLRLELIPEEWPPEIQVQELPEVK